MEDGLSDRGAGIYLKFPRGMRKPAAMPACQTAPGCAAEPQGPAPRTTPGLTRIKDCYAAGMPPLQFPRAEPMNGRS